MSEQRPYSADEIADWDRRVRGNRALGVTARWLATVETLTRERDEARAAAWPWNGYWGLADQHLAEAQRLVEQMRKENDDGHRLLASAHAHIIEARSDLEDDLK